MICNRQKKSTGTELSMQAANETSSCEIPENVYRTGSDFLCRTLPILDNAYKRWAFDLYVAQLSNAKNYLWIAFVIMSACAAFFDQSGLSAALLGNGGNFLSYAALFLLTLTFVGALSAFFRGVLMATGSSSYEPMLAMADTVADMEHEQYSPLQVYESQRGLMEIYDFHIKKACQEVSRRARQLSLMGQDTRFSICSGLGTLLIYWLSRL